jgi:hypothetical protein
MLEELVKGYYISDNTVFANVFALSFTVTGAYSRSQVHIPPHVFVLLIQSEYVF